MEKGRTTLMDKLFATLVVAQAKTPLLVLVLKAAFIALVSFGAPAGVTAGLMPRFFLGVTEGFTCPRGSEMVYQEWGDSGYSQIDFGCVDAGGNTVKDRFFLGLIVYLGIWFLACFYVAFAALLIWRMVIRKKYGIET